MRSVFRLVVASLACVSLLTVTAPPSSAATFTQLTLQNGWTNEATNTRAPAWAVLNDIVFFKGGMRTAGSSTRAFTLPAAVRPLKPVAVPIDLYAAGNGHMRVETDGGASVEDGVDEFTQAKIFTSLDGAFFARSGNGFSTIGLNNGWATAFERVPAAKVVNGIVYLKGAIRTSSTNNAPFVLPAEFRPAKNVNLDVEVCGGHQGRLRVSPTGQATVFDESGSDLTYAKCFTSLEGVSFARNANGFTELTLQNGWSTDSAAAPAAVKTINGIVHFRGAITGGTKARVFTLPAAFRPTENVFVDVAMCGAASGRITVLPTGIVTVRATADFTYAQCRTSLDGALFAL